MTRLFDKMNILLSSDDNYARHLGATIYSVLASNKTEKLIELFVIDNEISETNKKNIESIVFSFPNSLLTWIPFDKWKKQLSLNMEWSISLSSYARLFVESMVPKDIDRILYLDCDMIVTNSLRTLWETDLEGTVLGAVQDTINDQVKSAVGLSPQEPYFNAGMLLIDLATWRKLNIEQQCLDFISMKAGNVIHHDQGTLNGVLRGKWKRVPIQNNLMTIHYVFDRVKIQKYYCDHSVLYQEDEVERAKIEPLIIHYTPSFTTRPWVKSCIHPLKKLYWEALNYTPWKDSKPERDKRKLHVRLFEWRYRALPF